MSDDFKRVLIRAPKEVILKLDELRTLFEFDGSRNRFLIFLITEGIRAQANFSDDEKSREYVKQVAREIDQIIYEYEEKAQLKRRLSLEKAWEKSLKKRKKGFTVKERVAVKNKIISYLKKNSKRPVSKREIREAIPFSREKIEATLEHYNGTKWIIYEPQKRGQSHKVALIGTTAEKKVKKLIKKDE